MEQRRLRLGDILDDYCPRERRVTNHVVVAMIEEDVKQTRCTTCDAEHAYKGARVPKRRKRETPAALYNEVLAAMPETEPAPVLAAPVRPLPPPAAVLEPAPAAPDDILPERQDFEPVNLLQDSIHPPMSSDDTSQRNDPAPPEAMVADEPTVDGPVHRPLIRATLPRPEGQKDARPGPDFTVRHAPQRGNGHGSFRGERMRMRAGNGNREPNGNRAPGGQRFQGHRSGSGRPPGGRSGGFRNGGGPNGKRGRGSRG